MSHKQTVSIPSAPQTLPVSAAEPSASPLHPLQPVGRSFQHHVHTAGPLQWPQSPDHQIPVLCPQGTKKKQNIPHHFVFSYVNSLSTHHQSRSAPIGFTLSKLLQFSVYFISTNQVQSWQPFPSLLTCAAQIPVCHYLGDLLSHGSGFTDCTLHLELFVKINRAHPSPFTL